jgi:hypothetical protein
MLSDDELLRLSAEPEQAFLEYERQVRERIRAELSRADNYEVDSLKIEYITHVIAVARELDLAILGDWEVPKFGSTSIHEEYLQFQSDVDFYVVRLRLKHARRARGYSVALDTSTRSKIRHHLNRIRDIVTKLEIAQRKREALLAKLTAFESEVDRDRTRFDSAMALMIEAAGATGEAAKKLKPVRKIIDSITDLIKSAKDEEDSGSPSLPPPEERKRIEPPRASSPSDKGSSLDDDIPF